MGLLTTDLKYDVAAHRLPGPATDVDLERLNRTWRQCDAGLARAIRVPTASIAGEIAILPFAPTLRYVGQGYELARPDIRPTDRRRASDPPHVRSIPLGARRPSMGISSPTSPIEIVNIRIERRGADADHPPGERQSKAAASATALLKKAHTFFRRSGRLERMEAAFYRRELLPVGSRVEGPAIILQTDSTTVVPPGWTIVADGSGNLIMKARGAA